MSRPTKSVGAIVIRDGACLAARRGPKMHFSDQWEFPGGKVEPGESPEDALKREIREELHIDIEIGDFIGRGRGNAGPGAVEIDMYAARQTGGSLAIEEHRDIGWFGPDELALLEWVQPASQLLATVRSYLLRSRPGRSKREDTQARTIRLMAETACLPATLTLMWACAWWWAASAGFFFLADMWDIERPLP